LAIEYRRDLLRLDQVVAQESGQALVEGEINVPENKAPIARILDINAEAVISSQEVIQDKVMAEGIIRYDILYIPEEDSAIDSLESEIGFTQYMDLPGARPKMASRLKLDVEHVDYELASARKINVKAVLDLSGQVSQVVELEAVTEFSGEDVEVLREGIRVSSIAGTGHSQTLVREDLELADSMPTIQKIVRKSAQVRINEKKAADNKVVVHGDVDLKLLYLCEDEDEPIQYISHSIPFSHVVEIQGAYQGMECWADAAVTELYADPREDINGELRIIDTELVLAVDAQVFEAQEGEIITDAYSPQAAMEVKKRKIKIKQFVGESQGHTIVKESVTFPEGVPKARKILYVEARPVVTDSAMDEGKASVEGVLACQVVYQTNDPDVPVASFQEELPFRHTLEIDGVKSHMDCESEAVAENVNFTLLAQDEVELKIPVLCRVSVSQIIEKDVIISAEEVEEAAGKEPGIYIYYVKPDDTLWSIAKKYNTTISNILKYNPMDNEAVSPGTRLLIFKKLDSSVI